MSNWLNSFLKQAEDIDPLDPLYGLKHLLEEMSFLNKNSKIYYNHWFRALPEQLKNDQALLARARRLCIENFNFDPFEGDKAVITDLPHSLILHFHEFFETMQRKRPELNGPEFDTGDDFAANEGKNEIFKEWIEELRNQVILNGRLVTIKDGSGDLVEPFRSKIRQYCIKAMKFDPYQADEQVESEIPSAEDLNDQWGF